MRGRRRNRRQGGEEEEEKEEEEYDEERAEGGCGLSEINFPFCQSSHLR